MSVIDTEDLPVVERKPGWYGRYFDSANMTFGHYEFAEGAVIHRHHHVQEEVWHVIEGTLGISIGDATHVAGPGFVAIVPPNVPHEITALSDGKAIVVDFPLREGFTGLR